MSYTAVTEGDAATPSYMNALLDEVVASGLDVINVRHATYGATGDGTTDDTAAVQAALTAAPAAGAIIWFPPGTYLVDVLTHANRVHLRGAGRSSIIKLKTPVISGSECVTLSVAGSSIHDLHFDGNSTSRSCVEVTADNCEVHITAQNVTSDLGGEVDTSCVVVTSGDNAVISVVADNITNTGNANASVPRLVTLQGTATEYTVLHAIGRGNQNNGVTVGTATVRGVINFLDIENATDNGLYHLGGDVDVGEVIYDGSEEAIVTAGNLTIDNIVVKGSGSAAVGIQDADTVHIGSITIREDGSLNTTLTLLRTRSGNTASGVVYIGEVNGFMQPSTLMQITTGTLDQLTVRNINLEYRYDAGVSGVITQWWNISGCKRFDIRDCYILIVDEANALTSSNWFAVVLPTTNLDGESMWRDNTILVMDADKTTTSDGYVRIQNLAQSLIYFDNVPWQANIGPHGRETTYAEPNTVNVVPTGGTWRAGQLLYDSTPSGSGKIGWVCTAAGTPGTWKTWGAIDA